MMKQTIQILIILILSLSFRSCKKKHDYPKELEFCFEYLNENWDKEEIEIFKNITENDTTPRNYHFGIGLHLRNALIRNHTYSDTLQEYFNRNGIFEPDDMSGIILRSYHKYLNNEDLELEEQFKYYISYWEWMKSDHDKKDSLARSYFELFNLSDTIQALMPIGDDNEAINYSNYLDWDKENHAAFEITGIVVDKHFSDTTEMMTIDVTVIKRSKENAKIFTRPVNIGDTFNIQLNTCWKLKKVD